jgi:hypothetical protein
MKKKRTKRTPYQYYTPVSHRLPELNKIYEKIKKALDNDKGL